MLDPSSFLMHLRPGKENPNHWVLDEVDRRRPGYRHEQRLKIIGLLLLGALVLFALLMGWDVHL